MYSQPPILTFPRKRGEGIRMPFFSNPNNRQAISQNNLRLLRSNGSLLPKVSGCG